MDITINTQGGVVNIYPSETSIGEVEAEGGEAEESSAFDAGFRRGAQETAFAAQQAFINGNMGEWLNQVGVGFQEDRGWLGLQKDGDPHHNEPEGTGEEEDNTDVEIGLDVEELVGRQLVLTFKDRESREAFEAGSRAIHPVVDSGEPEKEAEPVAEEEGTWTISNAELNSRINEAYRRGKADGALEPKETTARTIQIMTTELITQVWPEGIPAGLSKQEVFEAYGTALLKRVGFEVFA